jgi:hypothetical protein
VGGRLAGEIAVLQFREGGVDVVNVESDGRRGPAVRIDFADYQYLDDKRL